MKPRADPGDIVAAGYDELGDRFERWAAMVHDPVRDRLFDQLFERLPDRAPVLDVGCGSGIPWTARLAERFEVTGIDISPRQVEAARRAVAVGMAREGAKILCARRRERCLPGGGRESGTSVCGSKRAVATPQSG